VTDVLWHCPVHGLSSAVPMGDGIWCLVEAPDRPGGTCGRRCTGPAVVEATGREIAPAPPRDSLQQEKPKNYRAEIARGDAKRKEEAVARKKAKKAKKPKKPAQKQRRRLAGEKICEQCCRDMEGEALRATRCTPCRELVPTPTWCDWKKRSGLKVARQRAAERAGRAPPRDPEELPPGVVRQGEVLHCYHCGAEDCGPDHRCRQMEEAAARGELGDPAAPGTDRGEDIPDSIPADYSPGHSGDGPEAVPERFRGAEPAPRTSDSGHLNEGGETGSSAPAGLSLIERIEALEQALLEVAGGGDLRAEIEDLRGQLTRLQRRIFGEKVTA